LGYLFSNLPQHYSNLLVRCEEICSVGNGYATSRALIAECAANNIPHIPWLGITQKNLVSLKEMGNSSFIYIISFLFYLFLFFFFMCYSRF
jgi:hypothetical protein